MNDSSSSLTVLLTGGSRGIGQAIKEHFTNKGFTVIAPGRSEMDLSSNFAIDNYISKLNTNIDILINNAGVNYIGLFEELSQLEIENTMQTNVYAPLRLMQHILPQMVKRKFGRVINISSIWSLVSRPGRISYAVSKGGINALTRTIALEVAKDNVLVNAVAPGFVSTELTYRNNSAEEVKNIVNSIPAGRMAQPQEIAEVVGFLASIENTYLVGQTIFVDGGYTCL